ncbi:GNAT family N-acetyltransferase [Brucella intermedia]|uniref:GNAT family N-acetyltransferase n=1 Tax=Brucella intermedia TaxID=94625 RepID=UPI000468F37F|nr:GNAT family N-acetyltransferase [Brucella intermedia]UXO82603.1 GNAT family N-acetyltransferase [Brucella intermedia]WGJ06216.1 GNAT family N-acetyltransferase [Brucella intermedia]
MVEEMVQPEWRRMHEHDIASVTAVANVVHLDFFEDEAVFQDRFKLYPAGCFVLARENEILGYGVSHPWKLDTVPALNAVLGALPEDTNTYYIHDIALLPEARSGGAATRVVELMALQAERDGFVTMSLVAVNGSQGFWEKKGFVVRDLPALEEKLKSYSEDALYMVRAG